MLAHPPPLEVWRPLLRGIMDPPLTRNRILSWLFSFIVYLRMRYIRGFLWHALYRNVNVPRDLKTMVVCGASEEVTDRVLEGAVLHILQKLCELKRQRNNFYP